MKGTLISTLLAILALLIGCSIYLAVTRIYQVDECAEVTVARILTTGQASTYGGNIGLLQFPLAAVMRGAARSFDFYVAARLVMVAFFWANVVLIMLATGERLLSLRGLLALLGAATLAPLWDYGFEMRHDNLLLTGLLLTWLVVRVRPRGYPSYFIAGALAVALQFSAHKAFVYIVPLALAILVFPPPGHQASRWKLALAWLCGTLAMLVALVALYRAFGASSLLDVHRRNLEFVTTVATGGDRFGPGIALNRLPNQTPLLLALVVSSLAALVVELKRRGRAALAWEGTLPEALLFAVAFVALIVNPTPFPYNLLNLAPYAFLLAFRHASSLFETIRDRSPLVILAGAILVFVHLVPFCIATRRHWDRSNSRQVRLMQLTEDLTDPKNDPVFDGVGMVVTRPLVDPRSLLHSLSFRSFQGSGLHMRDMLAARPAAVVILNYRTDWLPEKDLDYIREKYVPVADDFWVLGKALPPGGGSFEIVKPGRYRISSFEDSDLGDKCPGVARALVPAAGHQVFAARLDGVAISAGVAELAAGTHNLETKSDCQPAVVWVGPQRDRIGRLPPADHRFLFVNWY